MKKCLLVFILISSFNVFPQFSPKWNSPPIGYSILSGWLSFENAGEEWKNRLYTLDADKFQIMDNVFSVVPEYTYNFTAAEKLAGYQFYSLGVDLTGDNKTEFYVLGYSGPVENYRQSFKIIDITTGSEVFSKDDANFYFSYPVIWDVDSDGSLECIVTKFEYPLFTNYYFDVYSTGISGVNNGFVPLKFELKQNFPNPFNPNTSIEYSLNEPRLINLQIFNIAGELVKTLVNEYQTAGSYKVIWDGTGEKNLRQPTGIYFYRLNTDDASSSKKMILLK